MADFTRLERTFFSRPTGLVAADLLGCTLVHISSEGPVGGLIVETEAYIGEEDQACHARAGRTPRTAVMYGPPGHAYVYFSYGVHWMFNVVTEAEGMPAAVLVRAIRPTMGIDIIRRRRGNQPEKHWTDGPGKLCRALGIDKAHDGLDLCAAEAPLLIAQRNPACEVSVTNTARVGLNKVAEPWKSIPWRFLLNSSPEATSGKIETKIRRKT